MRPQLLAASVSGTVTVLVALIAVAGTVVGVLVTQLFEGKRESKRTIAETSKERELWLRDPRADLYVRTTTLYFEALDIINRFESTSKAMSSLTERARSISITMASLQAEDDQVHGRASLSEANKSSINAVSAELIRDADGIKAEQAKLNADTESLNERAASTRKELSAIMMPLQIFASDAVSGLADGVFAEINKAADLRGDYDLAPLYTKWGELHGQIREELGISDMQEI